MSTLLQVVLALVLVTALLCLTMLLTVRWAWRRTREAVSRRLVLAAPARLRVQAALPGPGREVAALRRELDDDVRGAVRAVEAGRACARPVEGLVPVVRRLAGQARALDVDLQVIAADPDRSRRRRLLAGQAERVALLRAACAEVRRGVLLAGSASSAGLLPQVVAEVDEEVTALALRARAYAELTTR